MIGISQSASCASGEAGAVSAITRAPYSRAIRQLSTISGVCPLTHKTTTTRSLENVPATLPWGGPPANAEPVDHLRMGEQVGGGGYRGGSKCAAIVGKGGLDIVKNAGGERVGEIVCIFFVIRPAAKNPRAARRRLREPQLQLAY